MKRAIFFILLCFFIGVPATSYGQNFGIGGLDSAQIITSPQYPEPNDTVTATLDAYAYNTSGATIVWYLDSTELEGSRNERQTSFTAGELGVPQRLTAQVTLRNGQTLNVARTIVPSRVDIVIEADTTVPPLYKGRALPSQGSAMRAIALLGNAGNAGQLTYTWSLDGKVLFGGPIVGKQTVDFTAPYNRTFILSVEVQGGDGTIYTKKNTEVRVHDPVLRFYEDNPLRGLTQVALGNPHRLVGEEITVRAVPLFIAKNILDTDPLIEWEINGDTIENPSEDPQVITLRGGGGTGSFRVNYHIRNLEHVLQGVEDDFVIAF